MLQHDSITILQVFRTTALGREREKKKKRKEKKKRRPRNDSFVLFGDGERERGGKIQNASKPDRRWMF